MRIDRHISDLLYDHECVIVPDMGGFLARYYPAEINTHQNTISPPSKKISFNVFLTQNDGLLANQVAQHENVSYPDAMKLIRDYVEVYRQDLNAGKKFIVEGVGTLFKDAEHNIQFEPTKTNFLKDSFALSFIHFSGIEEHPSAQRLRPSVRQNEKIEKNKAMKNRTNTILVVASILWLALNVFLIFPSDFNFASLNPFSTDTLNPGATDHRPAPAVEQVPPAAIEKSSETKAEQAPESAPSTDIAPANNETPAAPVEKIQSPPPVEQQQKVESRKTDSLTAKGSTVTEEKPRYYLVAGAFWYKKTARKFQKELKSQGFENTGIIESRTGWELIYIKSYNDFDEATEDLEKFKKENKSFWIYTR